MIIMKNINFTSKSFCCTSKVIICSLLNYATTIWWFMQTVQQVKGQGLSGSPTEWWRSSVTVPSHLRWVSAWSQTRHRAASTHMASWERLLVRYRGSSECWKQIKYHSNVYIKLTWLWFFKKFSTTSTTSQQHQQILNRINKWCGKKYYMRWVCSHFHNHGVQISCAERQPFL